MLPVASLRPPGSHATDVIAVAVPERADEDLSRGDLPDVRGEISARRGEPGAVGAPCQIVDQIDVPPQRGDLAAGPGVRDGHRPIGMSGGESLVVRAPCSRGNAGRMVDVAGQPARVGVPDLDRAIPIPRGQPQTVGAVSHGHDLRRVPAEDAELPPRPRLPDMDRPVQEAGGQLTAVRAPREPTRPPPRARGGPGPAQSEGRLFAVDVPDPDQAVGGARRRVVCWPRATPPYTACPCCHPSRGYSGSGTGASSGRTTPIRGGRATRPGAPSWRAVRACAASRGVHANPAGPGASARNRDSGG